MCLVCVRMVLIKNVCASAELTVAVENDPTSNPTSRYTGLVFVGLYLISQMKNPDSLATRLRFKWLIRLSTQKIKCSLKLSQNCLCNAGINSNLQIPGAIFCV